MIGAFLLTLPNLRKLDQKVHFLFRWKKNNKSLELYEKNSFHTFTLNKPKPFERKIKKGT